MGLVVVYLCLVDVRVEFVEIARIKRWILAIREYILLLLIMNLIHTSLCMFTATDILRCRRIKIFYAPKVYTFFPEPVFPPSAAAMSG